MLDYYRDFIAQILEEDEDSDTSEVEMKKK